MLFGMLLVVLRKSKLNIFLVWLVLPSFYSEFFVHSFSSDGFNYEGKTEFYQRLARSA